MAELTPHFVTCRCRNCDNGIEFDAAALTAENNVVACPHCGVETLLSLPTCDCQIVHHYDDDDDDYKRRNLSGMATPKQVAFLLYMGVNDAASLTKQAAADMIASDSYFGEIGSISAYERKRARAVKWNTERLILYPKLYAPELTEFLRDALPKQLHAYVRAQVSGASERLTKQKIKGVVNALINEDANWWQRDDCNTVFFERLKLLYPGCCGSTT
jgi:hypothetical protein